MNRITNSEHSQPDTIERQAFDKFSERLEQTVKDYVNDTEASDSVGVGSQTRRQMVYESMPLGMERNFAAFSAACWL
jgi:hypothetical protein